MCINNTTFIVLLEITLPSVSGMGILRMQETHGRWGQWLLEVPQSCAGNAHAGLPPAHPLVSTMSHACTQALIWLYCILMFSSWPCHPQDVFPAPLIRLTSCSCFKDTKLCGMYFRPWSVSSSYLLPWQLCARSKGTLSGLNCWGTKIPSSAFWALCSLQSRAPSLEAWQGQTVLSTSAGIIFQGILRDDVFTFLRALWDGSKWLRWCFWREEAATAAEAPCFFARMLLLICCKKEARSLCENDMSLVM